MCLCTQYEFTAHFLWYMGINFDERGHQRSTKVRQKTSHKYTKGITHKTQYLHASVLQGDQQTKAKKI